MARLKDLMDEQPQSRRGVVEDNSGENHGDDQDRTEE
jgi:hypothetical protein